MKSIINRWERKVTVGQAYIVTHPRNTGFSGPFTVSKIETKGAYAKAYGPRVIFEHGGSASIDDCQPV